MTPTATKSRPITYADWQIRALLNTRADGSAIDPAKPTKTEHRVPMRKQPMPVNQAEEGDVIIDPLVNGVSIIRASRGRNEAAAGRLNLHAYPCPFPPGSMVWARETWRYRFGERECKERGVQYRADGWTHWANTDVPARGDACAWREFREADPFSDAMFNGDKPPSEEWDQWISSARMPCWASRLSHTITDVRVERVRDISAQGACNEGLEFVLGDGGGPGAGCKWHGFGYWDGFSRSSRPSTSKEKTYHASHSGDGLCHCNTGLGLMPSRCAFAHFWQSRHPTHPFASSWCWVMRLRREESEWAT